jgi:hypothetical protein
MHYLLVTDHWSREHVVFQGERDSLEFIAARLRMQEPSLQARVAPVPCEPDPPLIIKGWCAPYTGA